MTNDLVINNNFTLLNDSETYDINGGGFWAVVGGVLLAGVIIVGTAIVVAGTVVFVAATVQAAYDWVSSRF
ncbi:hypothetical protein [uncultured Clostridium sp.]|uniref:hypothetical protein n=1 Tax=uncultured Clostridium sp. TaxID=59620 RepID=UPI0025D51905|nr:hypothetical protein [uncultured Clostridium sp.]